MADLEAPVLVPEEDLADVAGLDTVPPVLPATLAERLLVLPMLIPPRIVPPDVLSAGLEEFLSIARGPSV